MERKTGLRYLGTPVEEVCRKRSLKSNGTKTYAKKP
jgi:hypothetical protein